MPNTSGDLGNTTESGNTTVQIQYGVCPANVTFAVKPESWSKVGEAFSANLANTTYQTIEPTTGNFWRIATADYEYRTDIDRYKLYQSDVQYYCMVTTPPECVDQISVVSETNLVSVYAGQDNPGSDYLANSVTSYQQRIYPDTPVDPTA